MARPSKVFHGDAYVAVHQRIKTFLNAQDDFLSVRTASSPRAVGDAIQQVLSASFQSILGDELCSDCSSDFARRAMADIAFTDTNGCYCVVDVKTHRTDTKFNMPNLTSVDRLARFYEDDANYFVVLMVSYSIDRTRAMVSNVTFVPIEYLGWDCLTVGALGWGQIQIANSNVITINPQYSRKRWMLELCDIMLQFYPKEIQKIGGRITRFQKLRETWLAKPETI